MREVSTGSGARAARRADREKPGANGRPPRSRRPRGFSSRYARRRGAAVVAIVVCVLLVGFVAAGLFSGEGHIQRGVRIGAVDVGGMTKGEARAAVERKASGAFKEISFGKGPDATSVSGKDLGVKVDAGDAVNRAYAVGRGGPFGRVSGFVGSFFGGMQVDLKADYDEKAARKVLDRVARKYDEKPKDAGLDATKDGKIEVRPAHDGRVLDKEATLKNLRGALASMSGRVPLAEGPVPKPKITTADVKKHKPQKVIGTYKTDFRWDQDPGRMYNMRIAAEAVNNSLLAPGQVFSFDKLTRSLNYHQARTFSDGGIGVANGGGLCQVSSTLYMAAQYAGMRILERHPHYAVLPYIKPGFDATVWFGDANGYGALDMKFKNTSKSYVFIREFVDSKGYLTAQILGQPTGEKVELSTKKIYEDTTRGIKWTTYKKVTKANKVISDGVLHSYVYSYNPPVPAGVPHYSTSAPRVGGWSDPGNTTGWAPVPQ